MAKKRRQRKVIRSDADLARMVGQVARGVSADAIICGTETGALFRHLHQIAPGLRLITATPNGETYDALVGDGFDADVPAGLGARHIAAASVTARTHASAVVVSATDGFVRVFSGGQLVLQMDPDVPFGPITSSPS